ncbi:MAG: hypothetical protein ISS16_02325 [Ignavibacteria bacterium]|nr:hypothetical protein [Ignavibacteria bacterium]
MSLIDSKEKTINEKKIKSCILSFIILSAFLNGCDKDDIINGPGIGDTRFNIAVYQYSDNFFLVDTLYRRSFLDYYNNETGILTQHTYDNRILSNDVSFEVWVQCEVTEISKRFAVAYLLLYEEPVGGYSDTLWNVSQTHGIRFFGYFRKLNPNEYYISEYAGMIGFKINIPSNFHAGIVYKTSNVKKYGIGSYESTQTDTLLLKMFKTENQSPDQTPLAWELKLKNVYRLPITNVLQSPFLLDVVIDDYNVYRSIIPGMNILLLQITQLDRYQPNSRIPPPDGIFDFLPGLTIIPETGDIIFPTFRPFYDEFRDAGVDSVYWFPELYEQRKTVAQNLPIANKFRIHGYGESGR